MGLSSDAEAGTPHADSPQWKARQRMVEPLVEPDSPPARSGSGKPGEYVVVARRYRPQTFAELLGQEHVARALSNAISTQRVGHAYLFTGARGVGKTSAARILAKALNCPAGPTPTPCNKCDVCRSISAGDDVDVLEIDGASNRGIDEIRQLRQNVNVRPSRERFKIYIIDEVHMLTREAFNALLKTLEEPPEHVKFIFCTTEPGKIPITILSRCQRFDFAGIETASIAMRLGQIVEAEGVSAEPEALSLLARRAAGSMRDSQSLLEQLLAFAPERITVADVNHMLGTAGEERLVAMLGYLISRDSAAALASLDSAAKEGVDLSQLLEQLLGYLRDCMVAAVGCPGEMFLNASPNAWQGIVETGKQLGLDVLLAAMQILDQTLARMRVSTQARVLAELALVRVCSLENLSELSNLVAHLETVLRSEPSGGGSGGAISGSHGGSASPGGVGPSAKKKSETELTPGPTPRDKESESPLIHQVPHARSSPQVLGVPLVLTAENAQEVWGQVLSKTTGMLADHARHFAHVAISAPNRLVVSFRAGYTFCKSACERPDNKARLEQVLATLIGQPVMLEFTVQEDARTEPVPQPTAKTVSPHQRLLQVAQHPMVMRAAELFGANPVRIDDPSGE